MNIKRYLAIGLAIALLAGCRSTPQEPEAPGPPYFPDERGIVTSVSVEEIEIDGKKRFPINSFVQSFSTYKPKEARPILFWKNRYVHIGLDENKSVIWVAGVGVVDPTTDPPSVFYADGTLQRVDDKRNLIFKDGTVLRMAKGIQVPKVGRNLTLTIDPEKDLVVKILDRRESQPPG